MSGLKFISAVIFVRDIQTSKDFYTNVFKQEIQYDFGKNVMFKSGLSIWEVRKDHEIYQRFVNGKNNDNKFELYFESDELDKIISLIEKDGIKKLHGLKEEPWGQRTIRIFDPDDHLVEVGESMKGFVQRLSEKLNEEEVSKKTGLSITEIRVVLSDASH